MGIIPRPTGPRGLAQPGIDSPEEERKSMFSSRDLVPPRRSVAVGGRPSGPGPASSRWRAGPSWPVTPIDFGATVTSAAGRHERRPLLLRHRRRPRRRALEERRHRRRHRTCSRTSARGRPSPARAASPWWATPSSSRPTTGPTASSCGRPTARPPAPSWSRTSTPAPAAPTRRTWPTSNGTLFYQAFGPSGGLRAVQERRHGRRHGHGQGHQPRRHRLLSRRT